MFELIFLWVCFGGERKNSECGKPDPFFNGECPNGLKIASIEQVLNVLYDLANPDIVAYKEKKFGVRSDKALGIYQKDLNLLVKEIGNNNSLAIELFNSGIYEARILCAKLFKPKDVTEELMEQWVKTLKLFEIFFS